LRLQTFFFIFVTFLRFQPFLFLFERFYIYESHTAVMLHAHSEHIGF